MARRSLPLWTSGRRPPAAIPPDIALAAAGIGLVFLLVFALGRGPTWAVLLLASAAMAAVAMMRMPRHQDLLMTHQGLVVLGVGSGVALFVAFIVLLPIVLAIGPLESGAREVLHRAAGIGAIGAPVLFVVIAAAQELFWRGYVQTRLAFEIGDRRAYRVTVVAYAAAYLFALNAAVLLAALAAGTLWSWIRLRTGSLVPGIVSHVVFLLLMYSLYPL